MPAVVTEGASETRARHEVPVLGPSHNRKFRSKRRVQSFSSHAAGIDIRHTISRGEANPAGYNSP
jgi:hypothetical protein